MVLVGAAHAAGVRRPPIGHHSLMTRSMRAGTAVLALAVALGLGACTSSQNESGESNTDNIRDQPELPPAATPSG